MTRSIGALVLLLTMLALAVTSLSAQIDRSIPGICDACGGGVEPPEELMPELPMAPQWGYGYDSLLVDLRVWKQSRYVHVDSIGASVQGRGLWELTITSPDGPIEGRHRVYIHTRTHPNEVQSFHVAEAMIDQLIDESDYSRRLLERTIFHIVPMYNPDGVELELGRLNAHNIDLERNWITETPEPEVAALRARFVALMASSAPIEVALNMHSATACARYFVYHDTAGTSPHFTALEQRFITGVRSFFPRGIKPWYYLQSWDTGTATLFPEGWWWINYGEQVMALTYEDMNCAAAGEYDSTANAILRGIADYLGISIPASIQTGADLSDIGAITSLSPNPFSGSTTIVYQLPRTAHVSMRVVDQMGNEVARLADELQEAGGHRIVWHPDHLPAGTYLVQLQSAGRVQSRVAVKVR